MTKYVIAFSECPLDLADEVNKFIKQGYMPHGSAYVTQTGHHAEDITYYQPMIQHPNEE